MNKSIASIGTILFLAVTASSPFAGELNTDANNTLNVFVPNTTAVAADVNANFNKVADAVNDNSARIDDNTAAVTGLQSSKLDSANLGSALDSATTTAGNSIDANAAAITTNAAAIVNLTNEITGVNTALGDKLSIDALGSTPTALGNTVDGNAAAILLKADLSDITTNTGDIQDLQQNANKSGIPCAGNDVNDIMVRVGPLCVDAYEASVWNSPQGGGTQYGTSDNYPCLKNGNDCSGPNTVTPIYARSEAGRTPSAYITWFQSQQACANSGKRLLTNAEWQMAAAGTLDANCTAGGGVTGDRPLCVSNWGAFDMAGNVDEWVADWIQGARTTTHNNVAVGNPVTTTVTVVRPSYSTGNMGAAYGNDVSAGVQQSTHFGQGVDPGSASNFPAAIYRGADGIFAFNAAFAPSTFDNSTGFRCAR